MKWTATLTTLLFCSTQIGTTGRAEASPAPNAGVVSERDAQPAHTRRENNGQVVLEDIPALPEAIESALGRYQNVRSAVVGGWDQSGTALYITTRFADVAQLHRVRSPGGARAQLTFFKEPIGQVARQPKGELIAFTMDAGGSEFAQIFILDPKTGEHRRISDGESRNGALIWSRDGQQIAFQSTRRNGRSNDIWVMNPSDPKSAKLALESPDGSWWGPVDFSAQGDTLLALQYVSVADARAYEVDLKTGQRRLIAGSAERPSQSFPVGYDETGEGVYLTSNEGSEFAHLVHLNLKTGERTALSADQPWDVKDFVMSASRARAAYTLNEGGRSALYLFDTATRSSKRVTGLPIGVIQSLYFSPDERRLAITLNTSKTPSDAFVLELGERATEHGPLTQWTYSEVGGLDTSAFIEPEMISYPTFDQVNGKPRELPAFIFRSPGEGPHPVIISIHGGPEAQYKPYFNSTFQLWLKTLGATIIAPNVRGSSGYGDSYVNLDNGYKREDSVKDIGALLDWVKTQPDLDASRVAVIGGSYGGYMVLASAVHYSDRLKAAIDIVGISNFVTFLKNTQDYRRDLRRVEYGDERDPKMNAFLERISPSNQVEKIKIPMLVVQGENDPRVPVSEAVQVVQALRKAKRSVWYMNALNEGHGYRKKENRDLLIQVMSLFLKTHLK